MPVHPDAAASACETDYSKTRRLGTRPGREIAAVLGKIHGGTIIASANNFDTATMFVPIVVLMVLAAGFNWLIGACERLIAPWQAEIAGRDQS